MTGGDAGILEHRQEALKIDSIAVEQPGGGLANLLLAIAIGRQSRGEGEQARI
jgi:hypothetical protein